MASDADLVADAVAAVHLDASLDEATFAQVAAHGEPGSASMPAGAETLLMDAKSTPSAEALCADTASAAASTSGAGPPAANAASDGANVHTAPPSAGLAAERHSQPVCHSAVGGDDDEALSDVSDILDEPAAMLVDAFAARRGTLDFMK